jgi:hypothetical protein
MQILSKPDDIKLKLFDCLKQLKVKFEDNESQIKKANNNDCYGMIVQSNHIFNFLICTTQEFVRI